MKLILYSILLAWFSCLALVGQNQSDTLSTFDLLDDYYESIEYSSNSFNDLTNQHYGFDQVEEDTMTFLTEEEREEYEHEMAEDENFYYYAEEHNRNLSDSIYKFTVYEKKGYWGYPSSYETEFLYTNGKLVWINDIKDEPDENDPKYVYTRLQTRYYIDDEGGLIGCRERKSIITIEEDVSTTLYVDTDSAASSAIKNIKFRERPCNEEDRNLVRWKLTIKNDDEDDDKQKEQQ